jgi:hypothetical protein
MRDATRRGFFFATMSALATPASAALVCVDSVPALQAALDQAAANGEDDTIQIVRGTYAIVGNHLTFNSAEAHGINIVGGFAPGCGRRLHDARLSVLDGGGKTQIFNVTTSNAFELHFLTLQHGYIGGSSGGVMAMFGNGAASSALLANVIVRDSGSGFGIGALIFDVAGTVTLQDDLVTGIVSPGGAVYVDNATTVAVHLTNNTIVGNTAMDASAFAMVYVGAGSNVAMDASNNIFRDNGAIPDLDFVNGAMVLVDNDYERIDAGFGAGSAGNVSVDPGFAGSADFHLRPDSPLLGIGTLVPPGGLTAFDLEGRDRTWNNTIDPGVYERGDRIFADGYDV